LAKAALAARFATYANTEQVRDLLSFTAAELGGVDILVNNAVSASLNQSSNVS